MPSATSNRSMTFLLVLALLPFAFRGSINSDWDYLRHTGLIHDIYCGMPCFVWRKQVAVKIAFYYYRLVSIISRWFQSSCVVLHSLEDNFDPFIEQFNYDLGACLITIYIVIASVFSILMLLSIFSSFFLLLLSSIVPILFLLSLMSI